MKSQQDKKSYAGGERGKMVRQAIFFLAFTASSAISPAAANVPRQVNHSLAAATRQTQDRVVYTQPEVPRVVVQKNLAYRQVDGKPLRFDFYRLPVAEKSGALPVAIVMNAFGDPKQKENFYQIEWAKLFAAAGAALTKEDWAAAVAGYGKLVAQQPKEMELQRRFGDALFGAKEYARALEAYEQSYSLGHWRKRDISYPAAVAAARLNDVALALKWLERLVRTPFDRKRLLTDADFKPLHNHAAFRALAEGK